jgi:hypothetical protein
LIVTLDLDDPVDQVNSLAHVLILDASDSITHGNRRDLLVAAGTGSFVDYALADIVLG